MNAESMSNFLLVVFRITVRDGLFSVFSTVAFVVLGICMILSSVHLSVKLCIVAKRYIIQQVSEQVNRKCPLGMRFYNFQCPTLTLSTQKLCHVNDRMEVMHQSEKASKDDFHLKR